MSNDVISVIIPVFNREKMIESCINSVLAQEDVNTEIILIDDGSTDNSLAICNSYAEKYDNIQVLHEENKGVSCARNLGLQVVTGDYITFLDSDDTLDSSGLKKLLDAQKNSNADIVIGASKRFNNDGSFRCYIGFPSEIANKTITEEDFWKWSSNRELNYLLSLMCGNLYKKEIWTDLFFPEEITHSEDEFVLSSVISRANSIFISDYPSYLQLMSENSICRSGYNIQTLNVPYAKLVTVSYLIKKTYYESAIWRWGVSSGEIMALAKNVKSKEEKAKIMDIYRYSVKLGMKLLKYMSISKKIKFLLFSALFPLYLTFGKKSK